jgi:hypothetical protein
MKTTLTTILGICCLITTVPISVANAEVTSKPCPHSCRTMGIDKQHCRDWREGSMCFVDNLAAPSSGSQPNADQQMQRKIVMVNKRIMAGKMEKVKLNTDVAIERLDIVLRREGGSTDTQLRTSIGGAIDLGTQQIGSNSNHVKSFAAHGTQAHGRKLELSAISGDIFVESIHVLSR